MKANYTQQWLDYLCQSVPEMQSAIFVFPDSEKQTLHTLAKWPLNLSDVEDFSMVIQFALAKTEPVTVLKVQQHDQSLCDFLAQPVYLKSELLGLIVLKINTSPKERHTELLSKLEQSVVWFSLRNDDGHSNDFLLPVVNILAACMEQRSYSKALVSVVTELTRLFDCDQVAIGEFTHQHSKVVALSNSAKFDDRSNFIQKIADAMDEAIEQDCLIVYPNPDSNAIQRAHQELSRKYGSGSSMTIPIIDNEAVVGAMTLLRNEDKPFVPEIVRICKLSMSLLAPFLVMKKGEEQSIGIKIIKAIKLSLSNVFGFRHLKLKLALGSISVLLIVSSILKGDFQVTANAVLEGKMQRVIAAPIDGYLLSASVRAGDTVHTGDIMATLDDADLQLELNKLNGQLQKYRREYREALSANDLVKISVISAQIDQANAEMQLTRQQLQKIALTAPFDSVVIEGDLSQMLGSPVERGDTLFKIAPLEGYRIILKVDERLISYVNTGQQGILALSSLPDHKLNLTVEKITAVAKADDNANIFRVEASLDKAPDILRPGMEGIGKINVGRRSYLWIWTHEVLNWLRLWVWSWWL